MTAWSQKITTAANIHGVELTMLIAMSLPDTFTVMSSTLVLSRVCVVVVSVFSESLIGVVVASWICEISLH